MPDQRIIEFGQRVKEVRESLHVLQKDFAANAGISGSFLSDIEAGKTRAGYEFFYNLVETYRINPVYLLAGKGSVFLNEAGDPVADDIPDKEIIEQLNVHIKEVPLIRYAVLEFYKSYLHSKHEVIEREVRSMAKAAKEK